MSEAAMSAAADKEPLSKVHAMLGAIERQTHPHHFNRLINDPSIYPFVCGYQKGKKLDAGAIMANPANFILMGEHGGVAYHQLQGGLYEAHTQVLPEGRKGGWAIAMTRATLHWMFTRTDAVEICTRVPKGNRPALGLTRACGLKKEFTRKDGWISELDPIPADVYSIRIHDWIATAPGLIERGHWFHEKLESEYARLGKAEASHPDDVVHDRQVGAAFEMLFGGAYGKAMILYNRWAAMAGYAPVSILSTHPVTVDIRDAILCVRGDDFWVMSIR